MKTLEDKDHKQVSMHYISSLLMSLCLFMFRFVRVNVDYDHATHVVFSPDGTYVHRINTL